MAVSLSASAATWCLLEEVLVALQVLRHLVEVEVSQA